MTRSAHDSIREWLWNGEFAKAAWAASMLLEEDAADLTALALAAGALAGLERPEAAFAGLRDCAEAAAERGDLPLCLTCYYTLLDNDADASDLLDQIVLTYHRDAPRLQRDRRPAPPLPRTLGSLPQKIDPQGATELAEKAVRAARDQLSVNRSMAFEPAPIPAAPLLSSLSMENLRAVLKAVERVVRRPGELLVEQGEAGDAVFLMLAGWAEVVHRERTGEERVLRHVGPGAVVGEVALVTSAPRVASIRAETAALALKLTRAAVEELAAKEVSLADELVAFCQQKMIANLLDASPVLGALDEADREKVLREFDRRVVREGEVLVSQGKPSPGLFLLVLGQAEVLRTEDQGGEWMRLATLGPAEVFGEISLVLKRPATATVRMLYDGAVMLLPRDRFLSVAEKHPSLLAELYRTAEQREEETHSLLGRPSESGDDLTLV